MKVRWGRGVALATCFTAMTMTGCTGGQESTAAESEVQAHSTVTAEQKSSLDANAVLGAINPAIPLYDGATFRNDLTSRDTVMIRNQYGPDAQVLTLGTNDSFPQVWHYYVNYLAQYRSYAPPDPYPAQNKNWRTLEVPLNDAMKEPFIPGDAFDAGDRQVLLQIAETEAEPPTVIRYIITSRPVTRPPTAVAAP